MNVFHDLSQKVSPGYAMVEVKIFKDRKIIDDCHLNAHFIGEAGLEKHNFDAGQAFAMCEFGCVEGCFHGVMEGYIRNEADPYAVLSQMGSVCDTVPVKMPDVSGTLRD